MSLQGCINSEIDRKANEAIICSETAKCFDAEEEMRKLATQYNAPFQEVWNAYQAALPMARVKRYGTGIIHPSG